MNLSGKNRLLWRRAADRDLRGPHRRADRQGRRRLHAERGDGATHRHPDLDPARRPAALWAAPDLAPDPARARGLSGPVPVARRRGGRSAAADDGGRPGGAASAARLPGGGAADPRGRRPLPDWDQLEALKALAARRRIPLHMDGARLWESRAFYGRSHAEIAAGFASVYVSVYKGLGGIAGAVLAGDADFIAEARLWRRRMGGTLIHQSPMIVSAALRLDARLALLDACYARALSLAEALADIPGLKVNPATPQTNMMHLYFDAPAQTVLERRDQIAARDGVWLFDGARPAEVPGWSVAELYVGDTLLDQDNPSIIALMRELVGEAPSRSGRQRRPAAPRERDLAIRRKLTDGRRDTGEPMTAQAIDAPAAVSRRRAQARPHERGDPHHRRRARHHAVAAAGAGQDPAHQHAQERAARVAVLDVGVLLPDGPALVLQAHRRHRHRCVSDLRQPTAELPDRQHAAGDAELGRALFHAASVQRAASHVSVAQHLHGGRQHRGRRLHGRDRAGEQRVRTPLVDPQRHLGRPGIFSAPPAAISPASPSAGRPASTLRRGDVPAAARHLPAAPGRAATGSTPPRCSPTSASS